MQKSSKKNKVAEPGGEFDNEDTLSIEHKFSELKDQQRKKNRQKKSELPPVSSMRPKVSHAIILFSFLFCVVLPSGYTYHYLVTRALPQYVSGSGFTVRKEEQSSAFEMLGAFSGLANNSTRDIDVIYKYIQSQEIVQKIMEEVDLRSHYSRDYLTDPYFSLSPDARIEEVVKYWNRVVKIYYDGNMGLIELHVHAFTPEFAVKINELIIASGTKLINKISSIAQDDARQHAKDELDLAMRRLKEIRRQLTTFRGRNEFIDPNSGLQGELNIVNTLLQQLTSTQIELDLMKLSTTTSDPRVAQLEDKISIIQQRIKIEKTKFGHTSSAQETTYSDLVGEYEDLKVELEYAEQVYLSALATYEAAVSTSMKQSRYLAAYVNPTKPEVSSYPSISMFLSIVFGISSLFWAVSILIIYSIKDRR